MKPNPQAYAQALYEQLLETPTKHQSRTIRLLVDTVKQHQQLEEADKIIQAFADLLDKKSQTHVLHLISAQPLHNIITLSTLISTNLNQDIEIRNYINPTLIGGLIIRFNNFKIDLSLHYHVQKARNNQNNSDPIPPTLSQIIKIIIENQSLLFAEEKEITNQKIEIVDLSTANKVKLDRLEKVFSAQLKQKVIIHYNQDPELIGGAIIKYDSNKVDVSIDNVLDSAHK